MTYGSVVCRAASRMGGNDSQTVKAFQEAEAYDGPSLIIAYSHCIAHGYDLVHGIDQQKAAVNSGHWPLFRYNPALARRRQEPVLAGFARPLHPAEGLHLQRNPLHHAAARASRHRRGTSQRSHGRPRAHLARLRRPCRHAGPRRLAQHFAPQRPRAGSSPGPEKGRVTAGHNPVFVRIHFGPLPAQAANRLRWLFLFPHTQGTQSTITADRTIRDRFSADQRAPSARAGLQLPKAASPNNHSETIEAGAHLYLRGSSLTGSSLTAF